jgi:GNAT superfamily N-acetyltransferase
MHGHFAGMAVTFIHGDVVVGYDFVVIKALRRQGIGAAMLAYMGDAARQNGARRAALLSSTAGLKFYPHFGFQAIGVYPTFVYSRAAQVKDAAAERHHPA